MYIGAVFVGVIGICFMVIIVCGYQIYWIGGVKSRKWGKLVILFGILGLGVLAGAVVGGASASAGVNAPGTGPVTQKIRT